MTTLRRLKGDCWGSLHSSSTFSSDCLEANPDIGQLNKQPTAKNCRTCVADPGLEHIKIVCIVDRTKPSFMRRHITTTLRKPK